MKEIRRKTTIKYDQYRDGMWWKSTGYEVFSLGVWWNEYTNESGETSYFN